MMNIKQYLDSTYLKTPEQAGISKTETLEKVRELVEEAIKNDFYAVMIRPDFVSKARKMIDNAGKDVKLGTVIAFPEGNVSTKEKIQEATKAIKDGADELDFVINYTAFKAGNIQGVAKEVKQCNELVLGHGKIIKWIIEAAALTNDEIARITNLIKSVTMEEFPEKAKNVFVKSSTGFYKTRDGQPNGATEENIKIMIENAGELPVKAAGGVRTYQEAEKMVNLGVKRIGASAAKNIADGSNEVSTSAEY
ncbi:deoxyribose-phosphate aldolase [Flavobacteriaceae bacterium Ap0902]|nr:deoxyribose-phosphate aldolase [Flavobacteriaceae bacterium Ap0902]